MWRSSGGAGEENSEERVKSSGVSVRRQHDLREDEGLRVRGCRDLPACMSLGTDRRCAICQASGRTVISKKGPCRISLGRWGRGVRLGDAGGGGQSVIGGRRQIRASDRVKGRLGHCCGGAVRENASE